MATSPELSRPPFASNAEHLLAELRRLDLMLRRQILRLRMANTLEQDEFRGLYISDAQADALLDGATAWREDARVAELALELDRLRSENEEREATSRGTEMVLALPRLAALFGLSRFERDVLLIAFAPEFDLRYETLYAYAQNDISKKRPTVDLALQLLCPTVQERLACRRAFMPDGLLLRNHLVTLFDDPQDREPSHLARYLRLEPRVVDSLFGEDRLDSRLAPYVQWVPPTVRLSELALPRELVVQLTNAARAALEGHPLLLFTGPRGVGKESAARAICAERGLRLLSADVELLLNGEMPVATWVALLVCEARLGGAGLYLSHFDALFADESHARARVEFIARGLEEAGLLVFAGSERFVPADGKWPGLALLTFEFPFPPFSTRVTLWRQALADQRRVQTGLDPKMVANKFVLSPGQISAAARAAQWSAALRDPERALIREADLNAAARGQSDQGLRGLAQKIEPRYRWEDIVLPSGTLEQLHEVSSAVNFRHVVYTQWGFERRLALGKGLKVLFSGPSGTGKTMAADILAHELELDLYKIDLASVVSKYIGETEKNLERIFHEAQRSNALLFFDEADALFGKRSEVKDAHDRYANIEIAYLLQRIDEYEGTVILATNLSKNIDEAFARRMHYVVEFPLPDAEHRLRIWRRMFPREAPLEKEVDLHFLSAQFELTGGHIRNIALAAAFSAAAGGGPIRMEHLIRATAREHQRLGKLPSRAEFREYYELIRERQDKP